MELAEPSALRQIDRILKVFLTAALCSRLKNASVALGRLGQGLNLAYRHPAGFFTVDIFARFQGQDRRQRMPMLSGGDQHRIDVRTTVNLEHVPVHLATMVTIVGIDHGLGLLTSSPLDITDGHKLDVLLGQHGTQVIAPPGTVANARQDDSFARSHRSISPQGLRRNEIGDCQRSARHQRVLYKATPRDGRDLLSYGCVERWRRSRSLFQRLGGEGIGYSWRRRRVLIAPVCMEWFHGTATFKL